jgi:branched-subunit amino acid aminotransferase/4-amino-4-deoxychorismate lyase
VLPLFADVAGYVTESIASNVFFVMNRRLVTPPDEVVLGGITRRVVLQLAEQMRLDVALRPVHLDEMEAADEAFVTGTSFSILPVRRMHNGDPRAVPGPVTQALTQAFGRHAGTDIIAQSRARAQVGHDPT